MSPPKNFNEDRPIATAKCRPMIVVSKKYKVYAHIREEGTSCTISLTCYRTPTFKLRVFV